eukprot:741401-Amphidinium_carterae.1
MLPNIGCGVYGYEPQRSSQILVEEAFEALVQLEATVPNYNLKRMSATPTMIGNHFVRPAIMETAESFNDALTEVAHRWLPEKRVTTAPEYWNSASRRLMVLPALPNLFLQRNRVKFKKRHGVKKVQMKDYASRMKPWIWRGHRMEQPPPLLVYKRAPHGTYSKTTSSDIVQSGFSTDPSQLDNLFLPRRLDVVGDGALELESRRLVGDTAAGSGRVSEPRQMRGRPHFLKGVTHWLFPTRKSGFHALRKNSEGRWLGR